MNLTNYTEQIARGMNNPDCAFFVGSTMGQWTAIKYLWAIIIFAVLYKLAGNVTQLTWDLAKAKIKHIMQKVRDKHGTQDR